MHRLLDCVDSKCHYVFKKLCCQKDFIKTCTMKPPLKVKSILDDLKKWLVMIYF